MPASQSRLSDEMQRLLDALQLLEQFSSRTQIKPKGRGYVEQAEALLRQAEEDKHLPIKPGLSGHLLRSLPKVRRKFENGPRSNAHVEPSGAVRCS
jgi:hypothetical protein